MQLDHDLREAVDRPAADRRESRPFRTFDIDLRDYVPAARYRRDHVIEAQGRPVRRAGLREGDRPEVKAMVRQRRSADRVVILIDFDPAAGDIQVPRRISPDADRKRGCDALERIDHYIATVAIGIAKPDLPVSDDPLRLDDRKQQPGQGTLPETPEERRDSRSRIAVQEIVPSLSGFFARGWIPTARAFRLNPAP